MYVVIAGGGKVGRHVAADMATKGHEVTVIESERGRCEELVASHSLLVIEGDAADVRYLEQARVERANAFVATTRDDKVNLVSCQLAQIEFNVKRVIARVNWPQNEPIFEQLNIEPVSSTTLISQLLENEFSVGELMHLTSFKGGKVRLVELRIPDQDEGRPPQPRRVADLDLPHEAVLVAVFRGDETIIPRGETDIRPGDEVVALTTPELENRLTRILLGS